MADQGRKQMQMAQQAAKILKEAGVDEVQRQTTIAQILEGQFSTWTSVSREIASITSKLADYADAVKQIATIEDEIAKLTSKIKQDYGALGKLTKDELQQQNDLVSNLETKLKKAEELATLDTDRVKALQEQLAEAKKNLKIAENIREVYGDFAPYIGNVIDSVDSLTDGLKGMFPSWMGGAVDKLGKTLRSAAISGKGLGVAMAAVGAALIGAFVVLDKFRQSAEETATATGLTVDQSAELVKQSYELQASSENRLSTQKEILDANVALVKEFGNLNLISAETVQNVAGIADAFGVSVDTVAQVQRSFEQIGNVSPQVASDISTATMALAEAAGVQPAKVMEDIAKNAGVASKYFAGNPKALAKAAVEMAKIGLSLDKAASVAEGLLDIEKSLTAQFEASAMIGRQLNLDAARRLAINGDIAGATKEVLNQVGSIAEFEQMNVLQRKAIATAAGIEVDELQRSLVLREKTMNMTAEEAALVSKYGSDLGNINDLTSEEIANRAKSLQATEQLSASLEKIKSSIMPAIVSLAQALTPVFELLAFIISQAANVLRFTFSFIPAIKQDDMVMSPVTGTAGYSRVLSGPEGSYALNDRDTIVAGTNLGGRGGSAPEIDYNRMADAFANAVRGTQIVIGRGAVGAIGEQVKVNNSFA